MGKGNYSKIATGKQSITYGFLTKFYIAFGSELNVGELDEVKLENLQDEVQQLHKELFGFIQRLQQLAYYLTKLTSYVKKRIG